MDCHRIYRSNNENVEARAPFSHEFCRARSTTSTPGGIGSVSYDTGDCPALPLSWRRWTPGFTSGFSPGGPRNGKLFGKMTHSPLCEPQQDFFSVHSRRLTERAAPLLSSPVLARWTCRSHLDGGAHVVCQNDELGRPAIVMGAKAYDVHLSQSERQKIARKPGETFLGLQYYARSFAECLKNGVFRLSCENRTRRLHRGGAEDAEKSTKLGLFFPWRPF